MGLGGDFNYINNVVFNWRHRTVDGGDDTSQVNIFNNYYKPGPITNTDNPIGHRIIKADAKRGKNIPLQFGHFYCTGNIVDGNDAITKDNWAGGVQIIDVGEKLNADKSADDFLKEIRVDQPYPMAPITVQSAQEAYESVLAGAGATLPKRDPIDTRVVDEVRTGKVTYQQGNHHRSQAGRRISGI